MADAGTRLSVAKVADSIFETMREPMLVLDRSGAVRLANPAFRRLLAGERQDIEGRLLFEVGKGAFDTPLLRQRLDRLAAGAEAFDDCEIAPGAGFAARAVALRGRRLDPGLVLLAIEDLTAWKVQANQQMLLAAEFEHRLKNVLAVVQALARQTVAATVGEFRTALIERLKALGVAHLATLENRREGVELRYLLAQILAPYDPEPGARVRLEGPRLLLKPSLATSLALIFHELATNASKHGAFAHETGRVELSWRTTADDLFVEWRETGTGATAAGAAGAQAAGGPAAGGPTAEGPAAEGGFGTKLIERLTVCQLGGELEQSYRAGGLACRLRVPLLD